MHYLEFRLETTTWNKTRSMSNDVDERYSMYFVTTADTSEVTVSNSPFGQTYILSILIFIWQGGRRGRSVESYSDGRVISAK